MKIHSAQNARYKQWKHLLTKKGRRTQGAFLVEGPHLVRDALKSSWSVPYILTCSQESRSAEVEEVLAPFHSPEPEGNVVATDEFDKIDRRTRSDQRPVVVYLEQTLFRRLTETVHSQGIIAVIEQRALPPIQDVLSTSHYILMVDRIQDPGNLGTMIRTADAAGIDAVCLSVGTVDPYSGKALRASQGSIFHLPLYEMDIAPAITEWQSGGGYVYGADAHKGLDVFTDIPTRLASLNRIAVVIGNEANGLAPSIQSAVDEFVRIPIWGQAESLNASVASGIIMYILQSKRQQCVGTSSNAEIRNCLKRGHHEQR